MARVVNLADHRRPSRTDRIGGLVTVEQRGIHFLADGPAGGGDRATRLPVVLLHGASGNLRDFSFALQPSLARRLRVIALDRPGFGHSSFFPRSELLSTQVRVLRKAMHALGHPRYHLVGHSYGGALALAWARARPKDVASLGIIAGASMDWGGSLAPLYHVSGSPILGRLLSQFAPAAPSTFVESTLRDIFAPDPVPAGYRDGAAVDLALRPRTFRLNARAVLSLHRQLMVRIPYYPEITCPTAIIHGTADTTVPASIHAERLALRLPKATLHLIDNAGHMPHHTHTEDVTAMLTANVERAEGLARFL
ncbi:MAG: alpha/beta fold hydrolase [Pseudomonadota bacterium]